MRSVVAEGEFPVARHDTVPAHRADGFSTGLKVFVAVVFVSSVALAVRVIGAGFGADNDTFLMLATWDVLVDTGRYVPSRYQGYPVAEILVGAGAAVGGHWATGLLALGFGAGCVAALDQLLRPRASSRATRMVLLALLVATPAFVIASSTAIDYVFGLFFFLLGWVLLERRAGWCLVLAAASLVLAAGARVTYLPAALLLIAATRTATLRRRSVAVAACCVGAIAWYVPSWRHHEDIGRLLTADRPTGQGVRGLVARAGADGVDLLGLVGTAALCLVVLVALRQRRAGESPTAPDRTVTAWAIPAVAAYFLIMWLAVPVEPAYLLPLLAVVLVAVAPVRHATWLLVVAATAAMLHGWIVVEPYRVEYENRYGVDSCDPTEAVDIAPDVVVVAGELLDYPGAIADTASCNAELRRAFVEQWSD
jgi:hypothetical protein